MLKGPTINSVKSKSSKALGVFRKTVEELQKANEQASEIHKQKEAEAAKLHSEAKELRGIIAENANYIEKISNLIS